MNRGGKTDRRSEGEECRCGIRDNTHRNSITRGVVRNGFNTFTLHLEDVKIRIDRRIGRVMKCSKVFMMGVRALLRTWSRKFLDSCDGG